MAMRRGSILDGKRSGPVLVACGQRRLARLSPPQFSLPTCPCCIIGHSPVSPRRRPDELSATTMVGPSANWKWFVSNHGQQLFETTTSCSSPYRGKRGKTFIVYPKW